MEDNLNPSKKKTWTKPEIYLLDTNDVNGGTRATLQEGSVIGGQYKLESNNGNPVGNAPKTVWNRYHHS